MQTRDHIKLNLKGLEKQNWNILIDTAQETDGVICLVIMFIPVFMLIKMWQIAHYLYFLLMADDD